MHELYLLIDGEQRGPYSDEQARAMYLAGTITSDVQYWREGQPDWLPIAELFPPSEPEPVNVPVPKIVPAYTARNASQQRSPQIISSTYAEPPKSKGYLVWIGIVSIVALSGLGWYMFKSYQDELAEQKVKAAIQERQIPVQLKQAINDLRSATGTGIAKDPYANLVIALKSAYQTYGQNLPNDEQKRVREIIANYDLVAQLWDNLEEGGDIIFLNGNNFEIEAALERLKLDLSSDTGKQGTHVYDTHSIMSQIWNLNDSEIDLLYLSQKAS